MSKTWLHVACAALLAACNGSHPSEPSRSTSHTEPRAPTAQPPAPAPAPRPSASAKTDGCVQPSECLSGICEFFEPGCDARGKCAPPRRPLTQEERDQSQEYCACDGTTMKAWRPFKPYRHAGKCK